MNYVASQEIFNIVIVLKFCSQRIEHHKSVIKLLLKKLRTYFQTNHPYFNSNILLFRFSLSLKDSNSKSTSLIMLSEIKFYIAWFLKT